MAVAGEAPAGPAGVGVRVGVRVGVGVLVLVLVLVLAGCSGPTDSAVRPSVTAPTLLVLPAEPPGPVPSPVAVPLLVPVVVPAAVPASGDVLDGPPPGPQHDDAPALVAAPADRWAVLAGVTDYPAPTHDTVGGAGDVALVRDRLLAAGWLPDHLLVLTDRQVTGRALREAMTWLAARGLPGTFSLFHYSGHVKQLGAGTEALWPVDRDFVRDTEVTAGLSAVRGRLWVDLAGCEAASFTPGLPSARVLVSASSKATEKSYEYPPWVRSVWTGLLFDRALADGDADGDGRVTIGEALRYSTYYAQLITRDQTLHGRQTPQVDGDPVRGWTLDAPPA